MPAEHDNALRGAGDRAPEQYLPAEERLAINRLFAEFAWALDTGDVEALAGLFTEDARIQDVQRGESYEPPHAARHYAAGCARDPSFPGRQHWIGQSTLVREGEGWLARSFGMAPHLHSQTRTNFLASLGYWEDVLVNNGGRWQFKARRFAPWNGEILSGFPRFTPEAAEQGPASA